MSASAYPETNSRIFRFTTHPEDTPTGTCDVCDSLDGVEVEERLIGGAFPNAEQIAENSYEVHVHGKCACTLELVEDDQAQEPEASSAKPSVFSYWQEKEAKRENIEEGEPSVPASKFAYWKNTPEQEEARVVEPKLKTQVESPQSMQEAPESESLKEVKPPKAKLPETPETKPEVIEHALPEKPAINEKRLPKFSYWPNKEAKHESSRPATPLTVEEVKSSEPDSPTFEPESATTPLNQEVAVDKAAESQPERLLTEQIPSDNKTSLLTYWPTKPNSLVPEPSSAPEHATQQPLALPEPVAPPSTYVFSPPQPKHAHKTPVQYFSYWGQGDIPDVESNESMRPTSQELEHVTQYGYDEQPTFDGERFEKTFADGKISEKVTEKITPRVARKLTKFAYWNPVESNADTEDSYGDQENAEGETGDEDESGFVGMPLRLSPRRVFHALKNVRNLEKIGLRSISSGGGINPATAAVASMLIPLISELVRVEVELQLREHNKKMEQERNAQYRAAYASVTPL